MKHILKITLSILLILSIIQGEISFAENDEILNTVYEDIKYSNEKTYPDSIKKEQAEELELKQQESSVAETVNNYFIGTFRLYDEQSGRTYDFRANKAFAYDYKKQVPTLIVDRASFNVFTKQIEDYFSNKKMPSIIYPKQIATTNKYEIIRHYIGEKKIDKLKFENELSRRIKTADYSLMKIPFKDNNELEQNAIKNEVVLLSSYTTKYNPLDTGRSTNVQISGEEINGTMLKSNEKFYYNSRISAIYPKLKNAKIILNNKFVDGVGGGLCQVSTTLFNAVLESGMQINHRRCHSLSIGYVPLGRDAMVSDYNDFIFTNNFKNNIYIIYEKTADNEITFKIYGSKEDKKDTTIWVTGSGLKYVLHRKIDKSPVEEKFYSSYQKP